MVRPALEVAFRGRGARSRAWGACRAEGGVRPMLAREVHRVIVIHALWRDGLLLWGEDSSRSRPGPAAGASRPDSAEGASGPGPVARASGPGAGIDHPGAARAAVLAEILPEGALESVDLDLPTRGGAPLDSPEVVRDERAAERGAVALARWRVPALRYDADGALTTLTDLSIVDDKAGDVVLGASTRHLMQVAAFAGDLQASNFGLRDEILGGVRLAAKI